jgi:DNA invertase Pin-like site-specific DNA recombinase
MTSRALGYVRVSKAREEMISPELQRTAIQDWCSRAGAVLLDVIEDLDETGRNFARAGVQEVVRRIEAGEADVVVVWKWSRFGRNVRDCLVNIDRLEVAGGRIVAATEDFDDTPVGRFGRGQFLLMAQFESERIGEQWKEAKNRRLRLGLPGDGLPRFGYNYDGVGYSPDVIVGPVLAEMFRWYIGGASFYRIACRLDEEGVKTAKGGPWKEQTVRAILDAGFGAGLVRSGDEFLPGAHAAVISEAEWEAYRRRRRVSKRTPSRSLGASYPYAGLLHCGTCESPVHRTGNDRVRCGRWRDCRKPTFGHKKSPDGPVADFLAALAGRIDHYSEALQAPSEGRKEQKRRQSSLTKEAKRLDASLTRLTREYAEGTIPAQAYATTRDQITADLRLVNHQIEDLADDIAQPTRLPPKLLAEYPRLTDAQKNQFLRTLIRRIDLWPQGYGYPNQVTITPRWSSG